MKILLFLAFLAAANAVQLRLDPEACSGEVKELDGDIPGAITSPGFTEGENYPPNAFCQWRITRENPEDIIEVAIVFVEIDVCSGCRCDNLTIHDGPDEDAPVMAHICGNWSASELYESSANSLFITFRTDAIYQYRGFALRYSEPIDSNACDPSQPDEIERVAGVIASENFPDLYPNNALCTWHFHAPEGKHYEITTTYFEVENCCNCDNVDYFDGNNAFDPRIGRYFGLNTMPPTIVSSGRDLFVRFQSDFSLVYGGFAAVFQQVDDDVD